MRNMGIFKKLVSAAAAIALIFNSFNFEANAQGYEKFIKENPERAGGIYHYYEYVPSDPTKTPKGYKPFYISHYGRHGSRYHSGSGMFSEAVSILDAAGKAGLLTEEGGLLKRQIDTVWNEHQGMFGMLTARGAKEHQAIAGRMFEDYSEVFKAKDRKEVECVSSYWPRCLVSMANFSSKLKEENGDLEFRYLTGPKYIDYISMDLEMSKVIKESNTLQRHILDSLLHKERLFEAIFNDPAKAASLIEDPVKFIDNIYTAGAISPNTDAHPDIFSHFTVEELTALWMARNDKMYHNYGISAEAGEYVSSIAKPLIEDIVAKADAAVADGSDRAADLRFGHDVGLLPLLGTIGISTMENRWKSADAHNHWLDFFGMPMGANLQMVFFKNKKGDVLVKILVNERETLIPAVEAFDGPFYRWADLREHLIRTAAAISDEFIVKDSGEKERTGVAGM